MPSSLYNRWPETSSYLSGGRNVSQSTLPSTTSPRRLESCCRVRLAAELNLSLRQFRKWIRYTYRRRRERAIREILERFQFQVTAGRYFSRWMLYADTMLKRRETLEMAILLEKKNLFVFAKGVLDRVIVSFVLETRRQQALMEDFQSTTVCRNRAHAVLFRWRIAAVRSQRMKQLFQIRLQSEAQLAGDCFFHWQKLALQNRLVTKLQSQTLLYKSRRYYIRWILHILYLRQLKRISREALLAVGQRAFQRWKRLVAHRVVVDDLWERNTRPLLWTAFRRWRLVSEKKKLCYKVLLEKENLPPLLI